VHTVCVKARIFLQSDIANYLSACTISWICVKGNHFDVVIYTEEITFSGYLHHCHVNVPLVHLLIQ